MADVISKIFNMVRERIEVEPADLARIEREARLLMAGKRHRISMHPRKVITIAQVDERLRMRKSVVEVARELGVERSTIYRMLRKHRSN